MYLGDFTTSNTVYVYFNTFDSNDPSASVTITGLAVTDIEIYKDGSTTQRSSDAGYTLLDTDGIDFDGITGIHGFSIDLSDNTDAGFFAAGSEYTVIVSAITVDAATISFVAANFSIERAGGALALLKGTNSLANIEDKIDIIDTVVDGIQTDLSNGTDGLGAIKADTAAILLDTAEIGTAGAGLTAIPWNASWDAEVQSEVNDGLVAYNAVATTDLPTNFADLSISVTTGQVSLLTATQASIDAIESDTADMQPKIGTPAVDLAADIAALPTAAEINAEMVDVMETDTHAQPSSVPAATTTYKNMFTYLFTLGRNKMTQTATTTLLRNDADAATIGTSTVSDDATTFTRGKFI